MSKPQAIVVATDFSENASRAVRQAAHLARAWDASLTLVHVFNDSVWASLKAVYDLPGWADIRPAETARARLDALAGQIAQEFGITADTEVRIGRASQQIGDLVAARQADLLVVGEHGENWVSDIVLGGTALKVLEASRIPVLLVRQPVPALYRNIVIATDFSATAERAACLALECFPDAHHALIHAWLLPFESSMRMGGARDENIQHYRDREFAIVSARMAECAQGCAHLSVHGLLEKLALHGAPAEVVLGQTRAAGNDLIVIGKHGGEVIDELLLGSVTQNILYHADCDVLLSP
ncbi:MAG: universal stress protein [Gallionella sp.]|nr:universal stress protein [Gallionella sp.]